MKDENAAKGMQLLFKKGFGGILYLQNFLGFLNIDPSTGTAATTRPTFGRTGSFKQNQRKQRATSRRRHMKPSAR